jgi:hypothetical protein
MGILKSKRVFALVFFFFTLWEIRAQSDFRPGYIVTLQNDTVNGLINYGSNQANAKGCIFKKAVDQEKTTYTPEIIKAYRFNNGKYYISNKYLNFKFKTPVFLEYIIKGSVSIYYYRDESSEHFLTSKDTLVMELDNSYVFADRQGYYDQIIAQSQKFKGQLKYLMQDQPTIFSKINNISCETKDLIALSKNYQKLSCPSQECIQFEKKTAKDVTVKFGMFVSSGISNLSVTGGSGLDFKTTGTYEIGAVFNFYLNLIGEKKYSILLCPAFNTVKYNSYVEKLNLLYSSFLDCDKVNIQFNTVKIPIQFKYSFYSSNWSVMPYIKFGLGCAIYLGQKGTYEYHSVNISNGVAGSTKVVSLNTNTKYPKYYFTGGFGTDIKIKKMLIFVGATYEYGYGLLTGYDDSGISGQYNVYRSDLQLHFGFQF